MTPSSEKSSFLGSAANESRSTQPLEGEVSLPASTGSPPRLPSQSQLDDWENRLGIVDKIRKNVMTRKEISRHLGEAYINIIKAQKEVMLTKLGFWADEQNKQAYNEYQGRVNEIEKTLTDRSTKFMEQLVDYCFDYSERFWMKKKERKERLDRRLQNNEISEEDYQKAIEQVDLLSAAQVKDLEHKIDTIVTKQRDRLYRTVELFDAQTLSDRG